MKIINNKKLYSDFVRGWIIGNFSPSIFRTEDFEVGILQHKKDEIWPVHYHLLATEYNYLIKGKMTINNNIIYEGDFFIIDKEEISEAKFLEDCTVLVIKVPSEPGDKYEVF